MTDVDTAAAVFIVAALLSTVLIKYVTTVRTIRLRERLLDIEGDLRALRGKVKQAANQKLVIKRELKQMERKQRSLDKQTKAAEAEFRDLSK